MNNIGASPTLYNTLFELWTTEIDLQSGCEIYMLDYRDEIHLRPPCNGTDCVMSFGYDLASITPGKFSLFFITYMCSV